MNGDLSAGGDGIISDAQIYGNIIYDNNLAAGINMDGLENPIVYNNLIYIIKVDEVVIVNFLDGLFDMLMRLVIHIRLII